jgi:hypothetical protein
MAALDIETTDILKEAKDCIMADPEETGDGGDWPTFAKLDQ